MTMRRPFNDVQYCSIVLDTGNVFRTCRVCVFVVLFFKSFHCNVGYKEQKQMKIIGYLHHTPASELKMYGLSYIIGHYELIDDHLCYWIQCNINMNNPRYSLRKKTDSCK